MSISSRVIGVVGHRMHDDAALEAERLEHALHVLEGRVRRLVIGVLLRRIFLRIAVDVELAIAALGRRQRHRRARLADPLRKDFWLCWATAAVLLADSRDRHVGGCEPRHCRCGRRRRGVADCRRPAEPGRSRPRHNARRRRERADMRHAGGTRWQPRADSSLHACVWLPRASRPIPASAADAGLDRGGQEGGRGDLVHDPDHHPVRPSRRWTRSRRNTASR